jgi:hypothetical protein
MIINSFFKATYLPLLTLKVSKQMVRNQTRERKNTEFLLYLQKQPSFMDYPTAFQKSSNGTRHKIERSMNGKKVCERERVKAE